MIVNKKKMTLLTLTVTTFFHHHFFSTVRAFRGKIVLWNSKLRKASILFSHSKNQ